MQFIIIIIIVHREPSQPLQSAHLSFVVRSLSAAFAHLSIHLLFHRFPAPRKKKSTHVRTQHAGCSFGQGSV